MTLEHLERLAGSYSTRDPRHLLRLGWEWARQGEYALLGLAALAADLTLDDLINLRPTVTEAGSSLTNDGVSLLEAGADDPNAISENDSLLMEAFSRANGGMDPSALSDMTPEQLEGVLNNTRGHYFEALVVDRLNNGETLGEVRIEEGQIAELADNPNQPDWDVRIVNQDGTTDELLQLKATESMRPISQALRDNPDIAVVTTSEIDSQRDDVFSTDISNAALKEDVSSQLGVYSSGDLGNSDAGGQEVAAGAAGSGEFSLAEGGDDDFLATIGKDGETATLEMVSEVALDAIPVVSGVFIVVIEGRRVILGSAQLQEAIARGSRRLGTAAVFTSAGAVMTAAGAPGVVVIPPLLAARIILSRYGNRATMGEVAKERADALLALR